MLRSLLAAPWVPELGEGRYRNPILFADYSDPDCTRVGEDYFLTASSFNCTPGLPILHSKDLVNWSLIGHALTNLPDPRYDAVQPGCGVWAPAIRHHDGRFWIFYPTPDEGIFVVTAEQPTGPWSEPHCVAPGKGLIDPCPLWDDDGQAYLVHAYAHSRSGIKHRLRICPMAPDGSQLLGEGVVIADGEEHFPTLEGPKFLKKDGWYYVLAPAGGVATGWQLALRSRHIFGPYEAKRILEQGATPVNGPHQGALLDTPDGKGWWFLHFQDAGVYGRIVHLQPALWRDGWPELGVDQDGNGVGEPVATFAKPLNLPGSCPRVPVTSDDFSQPTLGLQWQWYANHKPGWHSLTERPGHLRLFSQPAPTHNDLGLTPHLLLQKFPAPRFTVETALDAHALGPGEQAGLTVIGLSHAALLVGDGSLRLQIDNATVAEVPLTETALTLRVIIEEGGRCRFAFSQKPGDWHVFETEFTATQGRWIGAKVGLVATTRHPETRPTGWADFSYFYVS